MMGPDTSRPLDASSVQRVARHLVSDLQVHDCEAKQQTLASEVFVLSTNHGQLVLKATRDATPITRENAVYNLLQSTNIPAPTILGCDTSNVLFGRSYLLMTASRGNSVQDIFETLSTQNQKDLFKDMGATLAKIHQVKGSSYGEIALTPNATTDNFSSWKSFHLALINQRLRIISDGSFHDLCGPVRKFFENSQILDGVAASPRLIHLDFHMKNVFVDSPTVVSEVIDWESACFGDVEEDLMRAELALFDGDHDLRSSFLAGYQNVGVLDAGYEERRDFYRLSRTLVHAGCLVSFGDKYVGEGLDQEIQTARDQIARLIAA